MGKKVKSVRNRPNAKPDNVPSNKNVSPVVWDKKELFQALIENSLDGITIIDGDGIICYESPSIKRILGYDSKELIGKNVLDLVHPDDVQKIMDNFDTTLKDFSGENIYVDARFLHKDGSWPVMESICNNLLDNPEVNGIIVNYRDITERRRMEEQVLGQSALLEAINKVFRETLMCESDEEVARKCLSVAEELTGSKFGFIGEVNDHGRFDTIALNDPGWNYCRMQKSDAVMMIKDMEIRGIWGEVLRNEQSMIISKPSAHPSSVGTPEGHPPITSFLGVPLKHAGKTIGMIALANKESGYGLADQQAMETLSIAFIEALNRKRMEGTLRESEARYRSFVQNFMGIAFRSKLDFMPEFIHGAVEEITGYTENDFVSGNLGWNQIIFPDDLAQIIENGANILSIPGYSYEHEYRIIRKDGEIRWVREILQNVCDSSGKPQHVQGVIYDITERKRTEEDLLIKENAIENSISAFVLTDMAGNLLYINRATMKLWGSDSKEELLGKHFYELILPEAIPEDLKNPTGESGDLLGEVVTRDKDGNQIHLQVASAVVKDREGKPMWRITSLLDITERKKAEELLRESEERFRRFVEEMNDGYCVIQGSKVVFANSRIIDMFCYTLEEVVGKAIQELLPPEIVEGLAEVYARRRRGESAPFQYEATLVGKDGARRPVEFGVRLIEYAGMPAVSVVIRDITERKEMEKAIRESEAQFQTIFEQAAIGIVLVDMKGKPIEINPAWQRMIGYDMEEILARAGKEYLHPEDAIEDSRLFKEIVAGKRDQYHIERRYIRKDGGTIWGNQHLSLVRGDDGEPRFIIAMIEDVTERKKVEEEREIMEQQLQLAGRLAAVGELAAGVAHELNNPLAAVQAYAQLLSDRDDLDETAKNDVHIIYGESQRASRITDKLLSFARKHNARKSLISINEVIKTGLEVHAHWMKVNNIDLMTELTPDLPETVADFYQMQQVLVNIISNAVQAMLEARGSGRLIIKTQRVGETIQAIFIDDGPGISEENLKRLYDPFFTTKEVGKGTGLGLSICYGIVKDHGGHIYVTSKLGEGSTFIVEIPIISEGERMTGQYVQT